MATENNEVHGTVIHSGYDSEPEADPTMEPSDQVSGEEPDDAAGDGGSSLDAADDDRLPGGGEHAAGLTEDDEKYMTAAATTAEDSDTSADHSAEDKATPDESTAEDSSTPGDSTAEDNDTLSDSTAEDNDKLDGSTAEDSDATAGSPAQGGDVLAPSPESAEAESADHEDSADEDEDQIIVADLPGPAGKDEPLDSADADGGEAADLEALDEEQVAPDAWHGQGATSGAATPAQAVPATDAVTSAQAAHAPAHSRMPSDTEFADDAGLAGDPEEMRRRWAAIQSSFVDDPRESVTVAASFLSEVMTTVLANARERENALRSDWDRDDLDTEELRTILRRYRGFIDRLAAL